MLINLREQNLPLKKIGEINSHPLFPLNLEYASPARGKWTIAHLSMLIPDSYQIYIGAICCLRGVVLSAAEDGMMNRFSMIHIKDFDMIDTSMENFLIDGVTEILHGTEKLPPSVLIFTTCIHHFVACDMKLVLRRLKEKFPETDFTECFMTPTMRKKIAPDDMMRKQLYAALEPVEKKNNSVNIIGNCFPLKKTSDIFLLLDANGFSVKDICTCRNYSEYKRMAESTINIFSVPSAKFAVTELERRLNQECLYLPASYTFSEIEKNILNLTQKMKLKKFCGFKTLSEYIEDKKNHLAKKIREVKNTIGNSPIAIDITATTRPFNMGRLLLENDFNLFRIYADAVSSDDMKDFDWIKNNFPEIEVHAVTDYRCRFASTPPELCGKKIIAIGQKAAHFLNTDNFVNMIENDGDWGFDAACNLMENICDAFKNKKDMRSIVQIKAWGCKA